MYRPKTVMAAHSGMPTCFHDRTPQTGWYAMKPHPENPPRNLNDIGSIRRYAWIGAIVWTLILSVLLFVFAVDNREVNDLALSLPQIREAMDRQMLNGAFFHLFILLLGLIFIWLGKQIIVRMILLLDNERNKLYESEERLRVIFETSESGIILVSPRGVIDFANRRMAEMFGMTLKELIGTSYPDHLHESEKQMGDERMRQLIGGEIQSVMVDRCYIRADGTIFWGHLSGRRIENPDGGLRALVGVISDVSERKHAEEERLRLEQQFNHAQKLESLGVLAGGIAHDFNNILTVILGHCYLGKYGLNSEQEYKESFQKIESAGNRAADLCRQMLTYAGKSPSNQTRVNLWLLVDEVVRMLQSAIKKNVAIELNLKRDVPEITGDTGQIQQIVMNLIINAAEAIGDANGTIGVVLTKIEVKEETAEKDAFGTAILAGGYACLEVSDTGCGMDEETRKRLFEPFYTTKFTGRGLGMSAIRGIVMSHNGTLQLTSAPGVGTTFKVCFPLPEAAGDTVAAQTTSAHSEKAEGTILLVDDEEALLSLGITLLETLGFSTITAQNGREAVEIYRERGNEIDMILLDLIMPVMGGIDAYHELRKIDPEVPIIFCSGYSIESSSAVVDNDRRAGFVHKPYRPDQLRNKMAVLAGTAAEGG
jgi:two-component system cell cycle sensor histidine kinase/response regulator CckA